MNQVESALEDGQIEIPSCAVAESAFPAFLGLLIVGITVLELHGMISFSVDQCSRHSQLVRAPREKTQIRAST